MSDATTTETISVPAPAAGGRVFDTGSEHENLRQAAAELTQRRDAATEDDPQLRDRAVRNFAAKVVGDYGVDRLLGLGEHLFQQDEEEARRNIAHVIPGSPLDKQEFSRGELRAVARVIGDYRARDNFQKLTAALKERAEAKEQSIAEMLGSDQQGTRPESQPAGVIEPNEWGATAAAAQAPQSPQPTPDPAIERERARLFAARQQYEAAVPQVAAIALQDLAHDAAQLRARGIHSVEELAKADPAAHAQYTAKAHKLGAIAQEVQAIQHRAAQEQSQQWTVFAASQDRAFLQMNPEMADASKHEAAQRDIRATLREMGIGEREVFAAYNSNPAFRDARVQTLLLKLSQAHMTQKRAAETLKGRRANPVPPVHRPGVSAPRPDFNQQRRAKLSEQLDKATGQKALKIAAEMRALARGRGRRGGSPFV